MSPKCGHQTVTQGGKLWQCHSPQGHTDGHFYVTAVIYEPAHKPRRPALVATEAIIVATLGLSVGVVGGILLYLWWLR
jgi:hypothetical protein